MNVLSDIYSIHFADGQLYPYWHNDHRRVHCARCRKRVDPGAGHKFRKARFADMHSGYWCANCVGILLACVTRWSWNRVVSRLFPANEDTTKPISGKPLAAAWRAGGYTELGTTLDSIK